VRLRIDHQRRRHQRRRHQRRHRWTGAVEAAWLVAAPACGTDSDALARGVYE
jgi:hypothetical protein